VDNNNPGVINIFKIAGMIYEINDDRMFGDTVNLKGAGCR
jgi:hypothetical protein